jgi:hypothetical protein
VGVTHGALHSDTGSPLAIESIVRRSGIWAYLLLRWFGAWIDFAKARWESGFRPGDATNAKMLERFLAPVCVKPL